ncbi:MAG: tol-pal system-associated acyl-CoA thioesterase [Alphaproteobacteria bacterium]
MHQFSTRVYYDDTDAGGVVYHANYLKFAERARTEALRTAGISQQELLSTQKIAFAVRTCHVEFFKPARLDDLLTIESHLDDIGTASLDISHTIKRDNDILVTLSIRLAVVGDGMKPARMPAEIKDAIYRIFNNN